MYVRTCENDDFALYCVDSVSDSSFEWKGGRAGWSLNVKGRDAMGCKERVRESRVRVVGAGEVEGGLMGWKERVRGRKGRHEKEGEGRGGEGKVREGGRWRRRDEQSSHFTPSMHSSGYFFDRADKESLVTYTQELICTVWRKVHPWARAAMPLTVTLRHHLLRVSSNDKGTSERGRG